jgi:uncharacterized membrane protein
VNPGFAERILALVESEARHRQTLERQSLDAEINHMKHQHIEIHVGQILGFLIGIVSIAGGTYAALSGAQWAGGFIGSAGVVGLVSVFVMGRKTNPE